MRLDARQTILLRNIFVFQVLLHTAGIVIFTLFLNATTIKKLLELLGMSEISDSKKIAMANAVKRLQDTTARTFKMLRTDRFLADAHWALAENVCQIHNPYIIDDIDEVGGCLRDICHFLKAYLQTTQTNAIISIPIYPLFHLETRRGATVGCDSSQYLPMLLLERTKSTFTKRVRGDD